MKIGYVRVSTIEQHEDRQIKAMKEQGIEDEYIFIDKKSGKNTDRKEFNKMMNYIRKGDIVYTESISRIARNTKDLLNIIEELTSKGVEFVSLKESIDTSTPTGKFILTIFGAIAELERENILERQKEGIAIAKEKGLYKGKPKKKIDKEEFENQVKEWRNGNITAVECMNRLCLKPNTFYRRVKEWGL